MRRGGLAVLGALSAGVAHATFAGQDGRLLSEHNVACDPPLCPNVEFPTQLASYLLDGSGKQQLTEPPNQNSGGVLSPDGAGPL